MKKRDLETNVHGRQLTNQPRIKWIKDTTEMVSLSEDKRI